MKKLALLIFIALLSNEVTYAQSNSLYILGTPKICPANYKGLHDGFTVTPIEREKISTQPILIYNIGSKNENNDITSFSHI